MTKQRLGYVLLTVALLGMLSPVRARVDGENPFGVIEGFWFPETTCELGVGWERIIFDWAQHQPTSPLDWHTLNVDDRWLKAANQCGREVVALLKNTPSWATEGIAGAGVPSGLTLPVDHPDNHWANFVRQTARYYAPRGVNTFIIWNEPDIAAGTYGYEFEGSVEDYAQLLKVASIAVRQGNPNAQIHLAGTTYWHNINEGERLYLDRLLELITSDPDAAANGHYFDALSLHIYFRTETVYSITREARALLDSYGLNDKAIWINETNAPPTQDEAWPVERPVYPYTLEQQAAFLTQAAALGLAAGAERIAVYKLFDQGL
ncbi:MAG: glycosyl hydrolase, partial [Phototrophicaceae bacterium]